LKYCIFTILLFSPLLAATASASAVHDCFAETEVVDVVKTETNTSKIWKEVKLKIKNNSAISACTGASSSSENSGLKVIAAKRPS